MRTPAFDLYLITEPGLGDDLVAGARAALAGCAGRGARVAVQLRAKGRPTHDLVAAGRALREITRTTGATLLVNDRVDVAKVCGADGVQLPETGMGVADARGALGPDGLIGVSRHDPAGLRAAARAGADFATLSPIHAVSGKGAPLGIAGFQRIVAHLPAATPLPTYALGGIQLADVGPLLSTGARGIAVIRAVLADPNPGAAAAAMLDAIDVWRSAC